MKDDLQSWKWESGGSLSGSLRDWFYRIILIEPYPEFATKKADLGGVVAGKMSALEDIHDDLHSFGGGTFGHMGAPAIGSFGKFGDKSVQRVLLTSLDPMFWLHHW